MMWKMNLKFDWDNDYLTILLRNQDVSTLRIGRLCIVNGQQYAIRLSCRLIDLC